MGARCRYRQNDPGPITRTGVASLAAHAAGIGGTLACQSSGHAVGAWREPRRTDRSSVAGAKRTRQGGIRPQYPEEAIRQAAAAVSASVVDAGTFRAERRLVPPDGHQEADKHLVSVHVGSPARAAASRGGTVQTAGPLETQKSCWRGARAAESESLLMT